MALIYKKSFVTATAAACAVLVRAILVPQKLNPENIFLKVVTNEKGEAVGEVLTIIC